MQRLLRWLTSLTFAFAVAACGGGSGSGNPPSGGGPLAGDPTAAALTVLADTSPISAEPQDIAGSTLLTRISVVLAANATVADVNAAAGVVGATAITFSRPGSPFMTFAVPRQASATDLEALARRLQGLPGILFASAGRQADPLELPATGGVAASVDDLSHLLATRFPAAWNVRRTAASGCSGRKVTLIVPDIYFGLPANFGEQMEGSVILDGAIFEPVATQRPQPHGYQVVGTLAAKFDALLSTGANPLPACLRIKLVNMHGITLFEIVDKTIAAVRLETGHVIVSSSVGYKNSFICGPSGNDECAAADIAAAAANIRDKIRNHFAEGIQWAAFVMQPAVVDRMLVVQAAGNDADAVIGLLYPGLRSARLGSPFAIATTLGNLDTVLADTALWRPASADPALPDLTLDAATVQFLTTLRDLRVTSPVTDRNLVLVGGTTNTPVAAALFKDARSNDGAALLAVGKAISTVDFAVVDGTSFAAPQVAGLAAYLWLLDSTLAARPVQDTITALRATTQGNAALTGIVDAYAAVLSLDETVAVTPTTAKIRLALLDVAGQIDAGSNLIGDGRFDLADLQAFRAFYLEAAGAPIEPTTRAYSRFDLNGDGFTGGSRTTRMDLDPQGSTRFGAPQLTTLTGQAGGVAQTYNESAITDAGALCFFATSALYTGTDLAARDALLRELCAVGAGATLSGSLTLNARTDISTLSLVTAISISVTAQVNNRGVIELRTVTGTGSETVTYASGAEFNCGAGIRATGRPPETKTGVVIGASGLGVQDGDPLAQVFINPTISGTETTTTSCAPPDVWISTTRPYEGDLSSGTFFGTPVVINGVTVAIDFARDFVDAFGKKHLAAGRLVRGP